MLFFKKNQTIIYVLGSNLLESKHRIEKISDFSQCSDGIGWCGVRNIFLAYLLRCGVVRFFMMLLKWTRTRRKRRRATRLSGSHTPPTAPAGLNSIDSSHM